jgi:hypothetical protein
MRPLAVGVAGGVILGGPPLYGLYAAGSMTGTGALTRGLIVVAVCTVAATFLNGIIGDFEKDAIKREHGEIVDSAQGPRPDSPEAANQPPGQPPT